MTNRPMHSGAQAMTRAVIAIALFLALTALLFCSGPDNFYLWVKAIHVIAVISWMAGMLYLPRLSSITPMPRSARRSPRPSR